MSCRKCGRRSKGRLCRDCERDARAEDAFEETFGREKPDVLTNDDSEQYDEGGER